MAKIGGKAAKKSELGGKRKVIASGKKSVVVLVATRKGAWIYHGDRQRKSWRCDGPHCV